MGRLTAAPWRSKCNQNVLVAANLLLEGGVRQCLDVRGCLLWAFGFNASFFGDKLCQRLEISATLVVFRLRAWFAIEPFQCWEALDAEALAQALVVVGIDVGDRDLVAGTGEGVGELFVDGGEVLAVATPRGEELDESGLVGFVDDLVEIGRNEVEDVGGGGKEREGREGEGAKADHFVVEIVIFRVGWGGCCRNKSGCGEGLQWTDLQDKTNL